MSESSSQYKHYVSEFIGNVKNKIESCIQKYMSLEETMTYLQENHKISSHTITKPLWEKLEKENPDFFKNYHLRCEIARQTNMFNDLLMKQVALMLEHGHINICKTSPKLMTFLSEHPEGIRIMANLANTSPYKTASSSSSLSLPDTNGLTVNQLQIPNDQQNQLHHCPWSTSNHLPYNNLAPAATDQWCTPNDLAYINLGTPTIAPAATNQWHTPNDFPYHGAPTVAAAATDQRPTPNDLACHLGGPTVAAATNDQWPTYIRAQTVAQAATTTPEYPSTFDSGDDIGHNGLSLQDMDIDFQEQELMQPEKQFQDLNGQYQQQLQLQHNVSPEAQQSQQYGGSNGQQYGGGTNGLQSIDKQLYHNFDPNQSTQMYTSVDQQQPQGVILHHHPEIHEVGPDQFQGNSLYQSSETDALNNPDNAAQNQHNLRRQQQQRRGR